MHSSSVDLTEASSLSRNGISRNRLNKRLEIVSNSHLQTTRELQPTRPPLIYKQDTMTSPRIHVSICPRTQIVLKAQSDFQPDRESYGAPKWSHHNTETNAKTQFSMKDDSCTDTDDDGHLIQRAIKATEDLKKRQQDSEQQQQHQQQQPLIKRRRISATGASAITMKILIDNHIIQHGKNVLTLEYRGKKETADVSSEGKIEWNGSKFDSPSAFSIHVKRLVNPTRKADDGWKTIKYKGRHLEYYKLELAKKKSVEEKQQGDNLAEPSLGRSSSLLLNSDRST